MRFDEFDSAVDFDEFEGAVLRQARESYVTSTEREDAALSGLRRRIALGAVAIPAGLELPPIPPASAGTAASSPLASGGALSSGAGAPAGAAGAGAAGVPSAAVVSSLGVKLALAVVALAGAGAWMFGAGLFADAPERSQPQTVVSLQQPVTERSAPQVVEPAQAPAEPEAVELSSLEEEETESSATHSKKSGATGSHAGQISEPAAEASDEGAGRGIAANKGSVATELDAELSAVRRAQRALRSGQPDVALSLMSSLDRMRSGGVLLPERRMTKVLALCALGRAPEAISVARSLTNSGSSGAYAARLQKSCAAEVVAVDSQKVDGAH